MMRKLLLAAVCLSSLVGCSPQFRARMQAEQDAADAVQRFMQAKADALPLSAKLECQMQSEQAAAAASNPRAMIDLGAMAASAQTRDTCLRMKIALADEQRAAASQPVVRSAKIRKTAYAAAGPNEPAPLADGRPWYCGMTDTANTNVLTECVLRPVWRGVRQ